MAPDGRSRQSLDTNKKSRPTCVGRPTAPREQGIFSHSGHSSKRQAANESACRASPVAQDWLHSPSLSKLDKGLGVYQRRESGPINPSRVSPAKIIRTIPNTMLAPTVIGFIRLLPRSAGFADYGAWRRNP